MLDFKKAQHSEVSLERVVQSLSELELSSTNRLWIAFSGGVDSTVLLQASAQALDRSRLAVLHINHGLSSYANSWEAHCEKVAADLGISFVGRRVRVAGKNLEFEGRRARFKVFEEVVNDGDVVATAHHRDDELESLMWQLSTGRALIGIANWRNLGVGRLWRPLLNYKRDELMYIARQNGWSWVEDESNLDVSLTRNALRHDVLPRLRTAFPDFDVHLLQLKEQALEPMRREPIEAKLLQENPSKVRAWLYAFNITPKTTVVKEVARQLAARADAQVLVRVGPHSSVRRFRGMCFVVPDGESFTSKSIQVGENRRFTYGDLTWVTGASGLPAEVQIQTASREGGEALILGDRCVKLSKWFYDQGVPPWERDAWPLFYSGEQLVAVPGLGVAASVSVFGGRIPRWQRIDVHSR